MPQINRMEEILNILKLEIKSADKIVIDFSKIIPHKDEWFKGDCSNISLVIGKYVTSVNLVSLISCGK